MAQQAKEGNGSIKGSFIQDSLSFHVLFPSTTLSGHMCLTVPPYIVKDTHFVPLFSLNILLSHEDEQLELLMYRSVCEKAHTGREGSIRAKERQRSD